ncbi:MAG TPA: DUF5698 domain-containing protein [Anaerolineales bacterium]|nr:DUF5698 domain-containing protein [Anaerolineales bacterium]
MLETFELSPLAMAVAIFLLRVCDMALDTLRVLFLVAGNRPVVWFLGFFQSAIWVVAITSVLGHLNNPLAWIGYAAGFATGNVVGMMIEDKLAIGYRHLRVISSRHGAEVAEAVRQAGYGATELAGHGRDGAVAVVNASVRRRDVDRVETLIREADPEAFIAVEEIRPVHRGYFRP